MDRKAVKSGTVQFIAIVAVVLAVILVHENWASIVSHFQEPKTRIVFDNLSSDKHTRCEVINDVGPRVTSVFVDQTTSDALIHWIDTTSLNDETPVLIFATKRDGFEIAVDRRDKSMTLFVSEKGTTATIPLCSVPPIQDGKPPYFVTIGGTTQTIFAMKMKGNNLYVWY